MVTEEENKLGEKYSKLNQEERKKLVKELSDKLRTIKTNNKKLSTKIEALYKQKKSEWDLESKIKLLKHTYKKGDYVVIKENIVNLKLNEYIKPEFNICKVLELKGVKDYIVKDCRVGLKSAYVQNKIHESEIVCNIESLAGIGRIKLYDESWKGKVN